MSVAQSTTGAGAVGVPVDTGWETVIGLEVHVQLRTRTKMFCRCENRFGAEPNDLVCPVCLGYPGTLPVTNQHAVDLAIRLALALGCEVRRRSVFARKNYFYPDLPKGYQISQYDQPLAEGGGVPLPSGNTVRIHRLHLEEDAGKLLHEVPGGGPLPGRSLVDFNRCGVPLVEIVTEPEIGSPADAQAYLQVLHQVLLYTGASDGNMEEGSLRCDANLSLRPAGETALGTKTEVKNLNSFRHVAKALEYERERQLHVLTSGGRVEQETRSFEPAAGVTRSLRSKEEAHDYRYFPEPDLPTVVLSRRTHRAAGEPASGVAVDEERPFPRRLRATLGRGGAALRQRRVGDLLRAGRRRPPAGQENHRQLGDDGTAARAEGTEHRRGASDRTRAPRRRRRPGRLRRAVRPRPPRTYSPRPGTRPRRRTRSRTAWASGRSATTAGSRPGPTKRSPPTRRPSPSTAADANRPSATWSARS